MIRKLSVIIILLLLAATGYSQPVNGVILADSANVTVIQVWGTHYERGYAQGYLLSGHIYDLYTNYLLPQIGSYMPLAKSIIAAGDHLSIDSKYATEAQGMVVGMADAGFDTTGVDYLDILVANAYLDLEGFPGLKDLNMQNGCSSLMSWGDATYTSPLASKSVISRHLDWGTYPAIINNQVIVAHIPSETDEQPWVMIGFAGQIGALSGVSNSGLSAFQHMMSDFPGPDAQFYQAYEPVWFTIRKGLEDYDYNNDSYQDCNDFRDVISDNPSGYADGFIISCLGPSTAGDDSLVSIVAELAPQPPYLVFRSTEYPDTIPVQNLYAANYEIKRNNHNHYCSRYLGVMTGLGNGYKISAEKNWAIMRDYSNSGYSNIQFMQFVPEDRYFNLAVYRNGTPAYLTDSVRYYLDDLFTVAGNPLYGNNSGVKIYPNPFSNTTSIIIPAGNEERFNATMYSVQGTIVMTEENIPGGMYRFSCGSVPTGVYILSLKGDKGSAFNKLKLVIY